VQSSRALPPFSAGLVMCIEIKFLGVYGSICTIPYVSCLVCAAAVGEDYRHLQLKFYGGVESRCVGTPRALYKWSRKHCTVCVYKYLCSCRCSGAEVGFCQGHIAFPVVASRRPLAGL